MGLDWLDHARARVVGGWVFVVRRWLTFLGTGFVRDLVGRFNTENAESAEKRKGAVMVLR